MTWSRRRLLASGGLGASLAWLGAGLTGCDQAGTQGPAAPPANGTGSTTPQPVGGLADNTTTNETGNTAAPTPPVGRVRYDAGSDEGRAMLAIYAAAVGQMMALPEGDPRSWTFWWYSHWTRGPMDPSGKPAEIARIYGAAPSAQRTLANIVWNSCQAHGDNEDESLFLPWHRMYVAAFEDVIRSVSGRADFTLPYWNYTDPASRALPPEFLRPDDAVYGPLHRTTRNAPANAGQPIDGGGSATPLNLDVLSSPSYGPVGADQGFCANLDGQLHGAVHVLTGDQQGMGQVPFAAGDPIFWVHHANIDRIWASWNAAGGVNPSDASFTAKPFTFAGPDGQARAFTVGQVLRLSEMGYAYDRLEGQNEQTRAEQVVFSAPAPAPTVTAAPPGATAASPPVLRSARRSATASAVSAPPPMPTPGAASPLAARPGLGLGSLEAARPAVTHVAQAVSLGARTLKLRLDQALARPDLIARTLPRRALGPRAIVAQRASAPPAAAAAATAAPGPNQRTLLVLSDLQTTIQPGVLYSIFLEAPRKGGGPTERVFLGALNFFGAMAAMPGMTHRQRAVSFDITAIAAGLARAGRLETQPQLSIVATGQPAAAAQTLVGSVSLVVQ